MTKKVLDKNQKVVKTIRTIVINILTFLESKALALVTGRPNEVSETK